MPLGVFPDMSIAQTIRPVFEGRNSEVKIWPNHRESAYWPTLIGLISPKLAAQINKFPDLSTNSSPNHNLPFASRNALLLTASAQLTNLSTQTMPPHNRPSSSRLSTATTPAHVKSRQFSHLNSQLAQLQAHLADLDNHVRITAIQAEAMKKLGAQHASMYFPRSLCKGFFFDGYA